MLVGWYLRRAIPWMALLGCWPGPCCWWSRWTSGRRRALVLLPGLVAACAAAAAFCFDEVSLPVVEVTPRGAAWRRTARLAACRRAARRLDPRRPRAPRRPALSPRLVVAGRGRRHRAHRRPRRPRLAARGRHPGGSLAARGRAGRDQPRGHLRLPRLGLRSTRSATSPPAYSPSGWASRAQACLACVAALRPGVRA